MRDSIFTRDYDHCALCGRSPAQRHHVLYGKNRKNADEDGFWLPLCMDHHTGPKGVHNNKEMDLTFKRVAQSHWELTKDREAFIRRYGRSYL